MSLQALIEKFQKQMWDEDTAYGGVVMTGVETKELRRLCEASEVIRVFLEKRHKDQLPYYDLGIVTTLQKADAIARGENG